jgi:putative ABC transport system ATP-binding protein
MNILGCLDVPTAGDYTLNGEDVSRLTIDQLAGIRSRLIGFVFQVFNLLPRMDAVENTALPLLYTGMEKHARRERALKILNQLGLERFSHHRPNQLSGGQQQRVAIARALINQPDLILADEPTGNLDSRTSEEIMGLFCALNRERGLTLVLVTHDVEIARHAQRLVRLVDGRIEADGPVGTVLGARK